jgi:hypothetical protein
MTMYAKRTSVPVDQTRLEIEKTLTRYGASSFGSYTEPDRAVIMFEAKDRRLRFDLPLPKGEGASEAKLRRSKWRALLLCIKAKLEAVESHIETFEEAFLAHVIMPDGQTVAQHAAPRIAQAYKGGEVGPLLPGPSTKK